MKVQVATTDADRAACMALRAEVFMVEQGVSEADELDGLDAEATHLLGKLDGTPIATLRLRKLGTLCKIERVCVRKPFRGQGFGRQLMQTALAKLREDKTLLTAKLGAQTDALPFYRTLGFASVGDPYLDAGIPHQDMTVRL